VAIFGIGPARGMNAKVRWRERPGPCAEHGSGGASSDQLKQPPSDQGGTMRKVIFAASMLAISAGVADAADLRSLNESSRDEGLIPDRSPGR